MNTRAEIMAIVRGEELRLRRSLGQSFLFDDDVLARIAAAAVHGTTGDAVVEIGAGLGSLTAHLAERARRVVAIEKDRRIVPLVRQRLLRHPGVEIVEGDALALAYADLAPRPAVAGNLPYSITSPLLLHLLDQRTAIGPATVMIQREVAERLTADPGSKAYGSLTVLFQLFADVNALFDVGPESFFPRPKVSSTVLRIDWLERPRAEGMDRAHFERVVRAAFSRRRKTLKNALASVFEPGAIEDAARATGLDFGRRAETLTLQEFSSLALALPPCPASSNLEPDV